MPIQIYKMLDDKSGSTPAIQITLGEAKSANEKHFGIFWTVNKFHASRKIENLESINAWAIDMDDGTKDEQIEKIKSGLPPTAVIETKRGFQVYFKAKNANPKHWNSIVLDRLVPFYGADKRARDIARILRVPGFYHWKDPINPFLVKEVFSHKISYSENDLALFYPDKNLEKREDFVKKYKTDFKTSGEIWESIWHMDCMDALEKVSGDDAVCSEVYTFRRNANGNYNILVDGKGTSCFIDKEFRIGSLDGGGPTIFQWINWFHKNPKTTIEHMKRVFPELPWSK